MHHRASRHPQERSRRVRRLTRLGEGEHRNSGPVVFLRMQHAGANLQAHRENAAREPPGGRAVVVRDDALAERPGVAAVLRAGAAR
jgi:hypothetical protein